MHGGNFYDDAAVHARYLAHHRDDRFSPNHVMEDPAVLAEIGDPAGLRVLDLGCGDGRFGRFLLDAGCASYHGVDGSQRMVALARQTLGPVGGTVECAAIENGLLAPRSADLVTARLSLHYLAELDAVLAAIAHALVPGGRLLITVVHPVITSHDAAGDNPRTAWVVDDYFERGPRTREWFGAPVRWHHRTVEDYVDVILRAGFRLTALRECEPVAERFEGDVDELARRRRVPLFLLVSARSIATDPVS